MYWNEIKEIEDRKNDLPKDLLMFGDPQMLKLRDAVEKGSVPSISDEEIRAGVVRDQNDDEIIPGLEDLISQVFEKGKGKPIQSRQDLFTTAILTHDQGFITGDLRDKILEKLFEGNKELENYVKSSNIPYLRQEGILPEEFGSTLGGAITLEELAERKKKKK
jgi:hypothetical protein